ncbi:MAG: hypothetical protein KA165_12415 [Saprospiraceae bacterium]|nr:hypothetical protein [Saprospiraceae bacterium]
MRIIGHIEHPDIKITVFKMDNRVSVKFENTLYEQTFKLGMDERTASMEAIQKLIDARFTDQVSDIFRQMHQTRIAGFKRAFPAGEDTGLEEII